VLEPKVFRDLVRNAPLIAIDLIVRNGAREVLLGLRSNGPAKDTWFVPGGRIWKDERIAAAFARITRDELGTSLAFGEARFMSVFEHLYAGNFADEPGFGTHYVVLAYEISMPSAFTALPLKQHSRYRWSSEDQLLQDEKVHPYTKNYFRQK
jgi:colanic acid biosynthesis protein WcaH